jgi:hypothetical protein
MVRPAAGYYRIRALPISVIANVCKWLASTLVPLALLQLFLGG